MPTIDTERFRLRNFVEQLVASGECEVREKPVDLVDVAAALDGNPRAVLFKAAGPEKAELVGNVMGSRKRLASALGTDERDLLSTVNARLNRLHPPVKVSSQQAPVQQVVLKDDDADLTALPAHLQHGADGAPYISAGIDYALFPGTGLTNVGCRRIMLRGKRHAGVDLIAPSDMRAIYLEGAARKEPVPVAYTVGSHPADFLAAMTSLPSVDELAVVGALRGAPVPVVKCVTSDIYVPADAEYVIEGFLDPAGHVEPEGPFGEYVGYYGVVKRNPVLHVTAITHREDALFQTLTISGRTLTHTDTTQLSAVKTEFGRLGGADGVGARAACGLRHAIERRHVQRARFAAPARARRRQERHCGRVRLRMPKPSTCSCSIRTSTCFPTPRPIGLSPRDFRPTAIWSPARAFAWCRSIRRLAARAPAPSSASIAPFRSARATPSSSRCRRRRRQKNCAAQIGRGRAGRRAGELSGADDRARQQGRPRNRARA